MKRTRGFGFITNDEGQDHFFQQSALQGGLTFPQLKEGQRVVFEACQTEKRPRAADVNPT